MKRVGGAHALTDLRWRLGGEDCDIEANVGRVKARKVNSCEVRARQVCIHQGRAGQFSITKVGMHELRPSRRYGSVAVRSPFLTPPPGRCASPGHCWAKGRESEPSVMDDGSSRNGEVLRHQAYWMFFTRSQFSNWA